MKLATISMSITARSLSPKATLQPPQPCEFREARLCKQRCRAVETRCRDLLPRETLSPPNWPWSSSKLKVCGGSWWFGRHLPRLGRREREGGQELEDAKNAREKTTMSLSVAGLSSRVVQRSNLLCCKWLSKSNLRDKWFALCLARKILLGRSTTSRKSASGKAHIPTSASTGPFESSLGSSAKIALMHQSSR